MVGLSVGRGDAAAHRHRLGLRLVDALEVELGGFMRPNAVHRPGKAVCDLAGDSGTAIAGIAAARARASAAAGLLPGGALPLVDGHVIVDIDVTLVASHSEKGLAAPNFKRGFGFRSILAFAGHGTGGTGAPLAAIDTVEEGAWVPAITGLLDLRDWPAGMRVVARKERAHPGAQLATKTSKTVVTELMRVTWGRSGRLSNGSGMTSRVCSTGSRG